MLSAISDSFSFSFLVWIPFISFSYVITMTGTSNTMLYEIVLFLILVEWFQLFTICMMLAIWCGLYYAELCFFHTHSVKSFKNYKWMSDSVKSFLCIHWNDYTVLFLLLIWLITFTDLQILNLFCLLGLNPTSSWCMILLVHWTPFANILLRTILVSMFIKDIDHNFLFVVSLSALGVSVMLALVDEFRSIPSSANFWCELFLNVF